MQTFTIPGPDHWASYLVNGDASSLTDEDRAKADAWTARNNALILSTTNEEARFTWNMRFLCPEADCEGGSVVDYIATNP